MRFLRPALPFLVAHVLVATACGPSSSGLPGLGRDADADADADSDSDTDTDTSTDDPAHIPVDTDAVYAHSDVELYSVDPQSLEVRSIGLFGWPGGVPDQMVDISLDQDGNMVGISYTSLYRVDRDTAACTFAGSLDGEFNGLSFVRLEAGEILLASGLDGSVYRVDPNVGGSTPIGAFGGGLVSSGDIVSVEGFGTVATAISPGGASDILVRIDPATGAAATIGETGTRDIWGLGYWTGRVFGFTASGQFVLIDPQTGSAAVQETSAVSFWGAGVTTSAPLLE